MTRVLSLLACAVLLLTCGGTEPSSGMPFEDSPDASSTSETPDAATPPGPGQGCEPACVAPQTCSFANVCIDPGGCAHDRDCNQAGMICDPEKKTCVPGSACGSTSLGGEVVPPNLLIVLDHSGSMGENLGGCFLFWCSGDTKWQVGVAATKKLLTNYASKIRFGMTLFPDTRSGTTQCKQGAINIPVGAGKEAAIKTLLDRTTANGNYTNIDAALAQGATDPGLADVDRASHLLLVTDGKQESCNTGDADRDGISDGDEASLKTIAALKGKGVSTFVVGFGKGTDPAMLNAFAEAGGTARTGSTKKFYDAQDAAGLDAALSAIAGKTVGCVYKLTTTPPDTQKIYVFFDGTTDVPRDSTHAAGWDYDAATNSVRFYGATCEQLQTKSTRVDIVYGCRRPPLG